MIGLELNYDILNLKRGSRKMKGGIPSHFSRTLPLSLTVVKSYSTAIYIKMYKLIDLSKNSLKNQKLIKWDQT